MAFRSDISIDWTVSPRIITIASPSTTATIQDLSDTIRVLEGDRIWAMTREYILDNEGKFDLGTKLTGISLRLINARLAFEARPGPTWAECSVTGGNLASVDDVGASQWPIEFTNYTSVTFESDVSAALIEGSGGLTDDQAAQLATAATESAIASTESEFARKLQSNRAVIAADDLSVTIYDDDSVTPLLTFDVTADKRERSVAGYTTHLWSADGAAAVDGSEGIYWLPLDPADTWEYATRDGRQVLRLSFATSTANDYRGLLPVGWPAIDFDRSLRLSGSYYTDGVSYSSLVMNWGRFEDDAAVAFMVFIENEPGFRDISVLHQMPDPVTQIPTYANAGSSQQSWVAGWLNWEAEWDSVANVWTATAWQPPSTKPASPLVTTSAVNYPPMFQPTSIHYGFDRYGSGGGTPEIEWLKLEYLS